MNRVEFSLLFAAPDLYAQVQKTQGLSSPPSPIRLALKLRGREMADTPAAFATMQQALAGLSTLGRALDEPKLIGRMILVTFGPWRSSL